jgi:hypothetical protein
MVGGASDPQPDTGLFEFQLLDRLLGSNDIDDFFEFLQIHKDKRAV